jgi:protein-histidine N-methyltransferase
MWNCHAILMHPTPTIFFIKRPSQAFNANPSTRLQYISSRACNTSECLANLVYELFIFILALIQSDLCLAQATSPSSIPYHSSINDSEIVPTLDITTPAELTITPELKSTFLSSLLALNVTIKLFSGSWNTFNPACTIDSDCYNVVLTSETICQMDSLESLVDLMQAACTGRTKESLNDLISSLNISENPVEEGAFEAQCPYHCLAAAKVLYFGVGGGVSEFLKSVKRRKGCAKIVQERKVGVGRRTMHVEWARG